MSTTEILIVANLALTAVLCVGVILFMRRTRSPGVAVAELLSGTISMKLDGLERGADKLEREVREDILKEFGRARDESAERAKTLREEVTNSVRGFGENMNSSMTVLREEQTMSAKVLREEVANNLRQLGNELKESVSTTAKVQKEQLSVVSSAMTSLTETNEKRQETLRKTVEAQFDAFRKEIGKGAIDLRDEVAVNLKRVGNDLRENASQLTELQKERLDGMTRQISALTDTHNKRQELLQKTVESGLSALREENSGKLEQMRQTVDEKLQGTLEKRLGESFALVSQQLEQVYKGLGEMQNLAVGVGDLKKMFSNVKARGGWGEVQLNALLEQTLAPEQFLRNVKTKESSQETVEFAIRLPGGRDDGGKEMFLPIDAKFPQEDYQRLLNAEEKGDIAATDVARRQLEIRIKACAKDICDKYLNPPATTDFGIMFLPTEGLYYEVLRCPGLADLVQQQFRVTIMGPTNLWALLNAVQMGFRSLAVQKRSSEVWQVLGAVKTEFGKYGDILTKVRKKLGEATNVVDKAEVRTRAINRSLRGIEAMPIAGVENLSPVSSAGRLLVDLSAVDHEDASDGADVHQDWTDDDLDVPPR